MPPRIRTRASKALKENFDVTANKSKLVKNVTKAPRKALADKTNSASDEASLEIPTKSKKTITKTSKTGPNKNGEHKQTVETNISKQKRSLKSKENVESVKSKNVDKVLEKRQLTARPTRLAKVNALKMETSGNSSDKSSLENIEPVNSKSVDKVQEKRQLTARSTRLAKVNALQMETRGHSSDKSSLENIEPVKSTNVGKVKEKKQLIARPIIVAKVNALQKETRGTSPDNSSLENIEPVKSTNVGKVQEKKQLTARPTRLAKVDALQNQFRDTSSDKNSLENIEPVKYQDVSKVQEKKQLTARPTRLAKVDALQKETRDTSSDKSSPDTNNNAKGRMSRKKNTKTQTPAASVKIKLSPVNQSQSIRKFLTPVSRFSSLANKSQSPIKKVSLKKSPNNKKSDRNLSFKLLGSKKTFQESENNEPRDDIYEFTFDPNEEPKPQKKKRKRTVTKKPTPGPIAKPKKVYKSSYDQNISKALAALRNAVKPGKSAQAAKLTQIAEISDDEEENVVQNDVANNINAVQTPIFTKENNMAFNDTGKNSVHECNNPSIRVEDIAADIEPSIDHHDDINYSPVNSPMPHGFKTPNAHTSVNHRETPERSVHNNDPLNLLEELSFFDEQPIASSSMNVSVRHPLASPWRVEFGSLPIKWPNNAYIKANMTPAVETSFINPEDSSNKRKHVYTNMLPQNDEMFTDVVDNTPNLKQPSIISFIKEMAEKSAKKKRGRSVSPTKAIYQGMVDVNSEANNKSAKKGSDNVADTVVPPSNNTSEEARPPPHHHSTPLRHHNHHSSATTDKENLKEDRQTRKRKNKKNLCNIPAKSPRKQKDKDCTFFGFDESEDQDENISPIKMNNNPVKGRSLRSKSKAVLQEINGPTRAVIPIAAKTKIVTSSEAVNEVYEGLKSGADAPVFPEKNIEDNVTNIEDLNINDDSQSVHLFEDIEVVHHVKPTRKSYGKAKKVTFRQHSSSDSDTEEPVAVDQNDSSDYDDLGDLTFEVPDVKEKKVTKKKKPKKLRSKKEEKEAEAWAANFNSMCEDIEEFPLLVE